MRSMKILVAGPRRAGTTSFIRSLSQIAVLTTERRVPGTSPDARGEKTIAMDFGRVTVSPELMLYLFGTPGEERESLIGGALAEGVIGLIVMVDVTRTSSFEEATEIVAFLERCSSAPYVVAANRLRQGDESMVANVRRALGIPDDVPVVPCDVTQRQSAKAVVAALLHRILATIP